MGCHRGHGAIREGDGRGPERTVAGRCALTPQEFTLHRNNEVYSTAISRFDPPSKDSGSRPMSVWKSVLAASVLALASASPALAARTDLVLGVVLEPPHLDPTAGAAAAIDEILYANVFEGLTRIGPSGEVLPALAESWTISDDGKVYTFKLHKGVKFHDGTDFDAEDVKFSL